MVTSVSRYHRHRFPAEIISHCVWLYFRFSLSFRDVEEMLALNGQFYYLGGRLIMMAMYGYFGSKAKGQEGRKEVRNLRKILMACGLLNAPRRVGADHLSGHGDSSFCSPVQFSTGETQRTRVSAEKSNQDIFCVINLGSIVPLALARIEGQCHDYALRDVLNLDIVLEDPS